MPELPEVEIVKRSLESKIADRSIKAIEIRFDKLVKRQSTDLFLDRMTGGTFHSLERRGKYLIFKGEKNNVPFNMINHLGMTGAWFVVSQSDEIMEKYRKHQHMLFSLDNGLFLVYCDIRKFGEVTVFTSDEFSTFKPIQEMGPEPFWENAGDLFLTNIRRAKWKDKPIKAVMLEQKVLAGVGNIYINEALFPLKIHPATKVSSLTNEELKQIFLVLKELFDTSIQMGGSSISDYVDSEGNKGNFQDTFNVYQKKECGICGEPIERIEIAKRSTFFCPVCQKQKSEHL